MSGRTVCGVARLRRTLALGAGLVIVACVVPSCAVRQRVDITAGGAGTVDFSLRLSDAIVTYLRDLGEMLGGPDRPSQDSSTVREQDMPVFNVAQIRAAFNARPGVELQTVETPAPDTLRIRFSFADAESVAPTAPGVPELLTLSHEGDLHTLTARIARENFGAVSGMFLLPDNPLSALIPVKEEDFFSREEYIDLFTYAFEEYETEEPIRDVLLNARIEIEVRPDGRIVSQLGGVLSKQGVVFSVPAVDVLTLERDLEYRVTWR